MCRDVCGGGARNFLKIAILPTASLQIRSAAACIVIVICGATTASGQAEAPPRSFERLSPDVRARIDARALATPFPAPRDQRREFYGDLTGWLISRTPFTDEEERQHAKKAHQQIVRTQNVVDTPESARAVFERLVATLPARMRPESWTFTLTVLTESEQPVFTVGGGYLYLAKGYLDELLNDPQQSSDRLAFELAHELGHICRGDCRWGYQLLRLQDEFDDQLERHLNREKLEAAVGKAVRVSGRKISFLYDGQQRRHADLFALHLCRNAGFDLEAGLDVLRCPLRNDEGVAVAKRPSHADRSSPFENTRSDDPVQGGNLRSPRSLLIRLGELREELDGVSRGDNYGLYRLDVTTGRFVKLADGELADVGRAIVFVHGIESGIGGHRTIIRELGTYDDARDIALLGFAYPDDDSLARSGAFLKGELKRAGAKAAGFDFVCHSAGGLVFRYYAEVKVGEFRQTIFQGTPHFGSDLARMRPLLEARQFLGDARNGFPSALENTLTDGKGQVSYDLAPASLFLDYLNRPGTEKLRMRYHTIRGRAIENRTTIALMRGGTAAIRHSLSMRVSKSGRSELLRRRANRWIHQITLPEEITHGDLAVTLKSASLPGTASERTYPVNHIELLHEPAVVEDVIAILLSDDGSR